MHETIPRQIALTAVDNLMCLVDDHRLARIASLRTFCAGGDGVTPCLGDSGALNGNKTICGNKSVHIS